MVLTGAYTLAGRNLLIVVHIDLCKVDEWEFRSHRFKSGTDHLAWPTPSCCKVNSEKLRPCIGERALERIAVSEVRHTTTHGVWSSTAVFDTSLSSNPFHTIYIYSQPQKI